MAELRDPQQQKTIAFIADLFDINQSTSPTVISFGYVQDGRCLNGLVIKQACNTILKYIINHPSVYTAHLEEDGLHVTILV